MRINFLSHIPFNDGSVTGSYRSLTQLCLQGFPMKFRVTCFYPLLTPRMLPSLRNAGYAVILVLRNAESNRDGYRSYICTYVFHISDSDRTISKLSRVFFLSMHFLSSATLLQICVLISISSFFPCLFRMSFGMLPPS